MIDDLSFTAFTRQVLALNPKYVHKSQPLTESELTQSLVRARHWKAESQPPPAVILIDYPGRQNQLLIHKLQALLKRMDAQTELILIDIPDEELQVPRELSEALELAVLQQLEHMEVQRLPKEGKKSSYEKIPHLQRGGYMREPYKRKRGR